MAGEQGTGKHPHKSAADPKEHHEGAKAESHKAEPHKAETHKAEPHKAESHAKSSETEHKDGQGTGKHPHKSAADPKEHHEAASKK